MNKFRLIFLLLTLGMSFNTFAQNSMVGDGFGGRLWYSPTNYGVGPYSAYSICFDDSSRLYGWGNNEHNQLGIGNTILGVDIPTAIPSMTNVNFFSAGYLMAAIKNDYSGWIWSNSSSPVQIITNAYFVDVSSYTISFVKTDGTVWSIGDNSYGQFGDGTSSTSSGLNQMLGITNAKRVANNPLSTIVLLNDSTLMSSGDNSQGNLGLPASISESLTPLLISGLPKIIDIKSNTYMTIALSADGNVYTWGTIDYLTNSIIYTPTLVSNLNNIVAISGCDYGFHFLALDSSSNCFGWGNNGNIYGSISGSNNSPILVADSVMDIMAGETFSYIVKLDGTLWATGNSNGNSIWLNLPSNTSTSEFTQLDPNLSSEGCLNIQEPNTDTTITIINAINRINFPNTFTPNQDTDNDLFYFPQYGIDEISWFVYNRWGNLVYKTDQLSDKWDGKNLKGEECSEGVYYYIVNYKKYDESWEKKSGTITLIR